MTFQTIALIKLHISRIFPAELLSKPSLSQEINLREESGNMAEDYTAKNLFSNVHVLGESCELLFITFLFKVFILMLLSPTYNLW